MEKYKYYTNFYKVVLLVLDIFLINIAFTVGYLLRFDRAEMSANYRFFFLVFVLIWWIVSGTTQANKLNGHTGYKEVTANLFYAWFLHAAVAMGCMVAFRLYDVPRLFTSYTYLSSLALTLGARYAIIKVYKYYKNLDVAYSRYVIVGANPAGEALYNFFESHKSMGNKFLGFFDENTHGVMNSGALAVKGDLADLKRFCSRMSVNEIFFAMPLNRREVMDDLIRFADDNFISFKMVPEFAAMPQKEVHLSFYDTIPVLSFRREPLEIIFNKILKRSFDIAFSGIFLLTMFPFLFVIIGAAIKLSSSGPVFFRQARPGRRNRLFECYKFRSMTMNTNTELQATKNDARITKVGAFLRKTSLDEIPQFINVFKGDMSIVGPRPNLVSQLEHYSKTIDQYKIRHFVTPGITGYAQVNGLRGETREEGLMAKRVEFDVQYIQNWSFLLDLKIIWLTVWNMVRGEKNAY